ncbi:hypothetical protein JWS13_17610 [Rhodococcus pseudokoreensis]|uniref:Uncharacterized protein n=1 Tax=Rhodococcus pseudokoreensis TaxID=2811421 RepID=A0A974W459_9NOCA|nr:hypothetical protein [Rhodococcus pseudokoreensis]QSE90307.1 hypothetical protein JWS13_17610 [Rhodococcus pseudokoreensis]
MTLNRFGEDVEAATPSNRPHHLDCKRGWLGQDLDGRPIPCIQCKPHLAHRNYLTGGAA